MLGELGPRPGAPQGAALTLVTTILVLAFCSKPKPWRRALWSYRRETFLIFLISIATGRQGEIGGFVVSPRQRCRWVVAIYWLRTNKLSYEL